MTLENFLNATPEAILRGTPYDEILQQMIQVLETAEDAPTDDETANNVAYLSEFVSAIVGLFDVLQNCVTKSRPLSKDELDLRKQLDSKIFEAKQRIANLVIKLKHFENFNSTVEN